MVSQAGPHQEAGMVPGEGNALSCFPTGFGVHLSYVSGNSMCLGEEVLKE